MSTTFKFLSENGSQQEILRKKHEDYFLSESNGQWFINKFLAFCRVDFGASQYEVVVCEALTLIENHQGPLFCFEERNSMNVVEAASIKLRASIVPNFTNQNAGSFKYFNTFADVASFAYRKKINKIWDIFLLWSFHASPTLLPEVVLAPSCFPVDAW